MLEETATVVSNRCEVGLYFQLVLHAPGIASRVQPGQFVHVRIPSLRDALLRRPFSVFDASGEIIRIIYKIVGKGTVAMARLRDGEELSVLGPLGRGFSVPGASDETPLLVAGGYGMAALYLLARRAGRKGIVFSGARGRTDVLCEAEFRSLGWEVRVTTEDGSYGERGIVTQPVRAELERGSVGRKLFACGPIPMLEAVAKLGEEFNVPVEVSLDRHMCCGVGACLTCVVPVRSGDGWEYQRACTEGPVFDGRRIAWEVGL
ncbi:MAG: dihydroorotate dehydrogenase electron transfer subunit [Verrucomicrobiae bacterium]|nr:dihydroorotate dehydrogenase electron transfer subunit [Verrucomicrobiae bacterium]